MLEALTQKKGGSIEMVGRGGEYLVYNSDEI